MEEERGQCRTVCRHRVVVEVAGDDLLQPSSLLGNRPMHAPSQFLFDGLQLYPHAVPPGPPFDLEFAPASFAADKGEAIKQELRRSMHQPIPQQGRWLQQVVTGYFNYHAVPTNSPTLTAFLFHVTNLWRRTLRQRSQKDWTTWERIKRLADDWLPKPQILHPWPERRFAVRHPRWEPYARIGPVRICAGGAR